MVPGCAYSLKMLAFSKKTLPVFKIEVTYILVFIFSFSGYPVALSSSVSESADPWAPVSWNEA
jgi:hypothetical protein